MISELALILIKFLLFLLLIFLTWFLPGLIFIADKKSNPEEKILFSFVLGMIIFSVLGIFLGLFRLRFLLLPILIALCAYSFKKTSPKEIFLLFKEILKEKVFKVILIIGILIQGFINFPSGMRYPEGYLFWSSQGHDGLWHVALMEEIKTRFPPKNPLYAGQPLFNYHYGSDILMGEFYRLFPFLGSLDLYFRFYPVIFSILLGLGAYAFAKRRWGKTTGYWAMFFTYMCGSFGYIYSLLNKGPLFTGETIFWASQGNTILGNPPHTMGIIILTAILTALQLWQKEKKTNWLFLIIFLGFGLATVKVSSGLVFVVSLIIAGLYLFILKREMALLLIGVFLGLSNFGLLKLISPRAESFLIFSPLWFPNNLMTARLGNFDWELRRQHYLWVNTWKSWLRIIQLEAEAIFLFVVGNSGLRILGLFAIIGKVFKKIKEIDVIDIFLYSVLISSLGVVMLFIQKGLVFNLIQFIQIYLHFLGFFAAAATVWLLKKIKTKATRAAIALLIIFLAIPTAIGNLFDFYVRSGPLAKVSTQEIAALNWLKNNLKKEEIVLTVPFQGQAEYRYKNQPWPISAWYSTPYVFVFSNRYAYLSGEEQLMITGYQTEDDLKIIKSFFKDNSQESFLEEKNISYIYARKDELGENFLKGRSYLKTVFENEEVIIYKVIK